MLNKLLAERFELKFHNDKRELSVYALTALKTPNKLTPSTGDPNGLPGIGFGGLGSLMARNAKMTDVTGVLQGTVLDRPVVDQSGVEGRYDFSLRWTPDEFQFAGFPKIPPPADNGTAPPDLFTAVQQQLGLKLESAKAMAEVYVIDHMTKPSEN